MTIHPIRSEAKSRGARMLRTALGPSVASWLDDPAVIEVMLNPDGRLWLDRLGEGISNTGELLSAADGERIVRLVAHHVGVEVHARSPRVSAELPEGGERFEGLLPPVVAAPAFAIRKPAVAVFTLDDYARAGIMSAVEAVVGNIDGARTTMDGLVTSSQSATGALQAAQAGNQLLALQSQQLADLTALLAAQGRAQALDSARNAAVEAESRERLRRFLTRSTGYQPGNARMFRD